MSPQRSGYAFLGFATPVALLAFIPNPGWFAATFPGWLTFGGLLLLGQALLFSQTGTPWVLFPLILSAWVVGADYGLPSAVGLPLLAIGALAAANCRLPKTRVFARLFGGLVGLWLVWAIWGWCVNGIFPAESRMGFIKFFSPDWPEECQWPRLEWPLGNANPMAGVLLMLIPLGLALTVAEAKHKLWRTPWAILTAVTVGLLVACGSRAGLGALAVAAVAYVATLPSSRLSLKIKVVAGLGAVGSVVGALLLIPRYRTRLFLGDQVSYSDAVRRDFIETGLNMFRDRPLTGFGPGGVPVHYSAYLSDFSDQPGCHQLHNTPLHWAVEFGILGPSLWLGLVALSLLALKKAHVAEAHRSLRTGAALAAVGYAAFSFFDYQLYLPLTAFLWGSCLGLAWNGVALPTLPTRLKRAAGFALAALLITTGFRLASDAPGRYQAWLARQSLTAQNIPEALDRLGLAMKASPQNPVYPAVTATLVATLKTEDAQGAAQNRALADAMFAEARRLAPDFPYLTALHGLLWADANPVKAEALFREALRRNPKLPVAWQGLARALAHQGKQDEAVTALALNGMIVPEDLFSPEIRTGFFQGASRRVFARFRELQDAYGRAHPEDLGGITRLAQVRRQLDAWEKSGENVRTFVAQNPDWSRRPLWRHLASVEMARDKDDQYPLRARMIMSATLHAVTGMEPKDNHACDLLDQCAGVGRPFEAGRILTAPDSFGAFGQYFGDTHLPLTPMVTGKEDILARLYVYEGAPIRPHLGGDFFTRHTSP